MCSHLVTPLSACVFQDDIAKTLTKTIGDREALKNALKPLKGAAATASRNATVVEFDGASVPVFPCVWAGVQLPVSQQSSEPHQPCATASYAHLSGASAHC